MIALRNSTKSRLFSTVAFLLLCVQWWGAQPVDALILRQELEIDTKKSRDFVLWFPDIDSTLDLEDLQTFIKITREYLQQDGDLTFESLKVLRQGIESIDKLPLSKSILFQSGGKNILEDYLAKKMGLMIHILATAEKTDSIVAFLSNNWEEYVVRLDSGGLKQFASPLSALVSRSTDPTTLKKSFTWTFVALVVSIVTLAIVVLARRTGRRRHLANLRAIMDATSRARVNESMQSDRFSFS